VDSHEQPVAGLTVSQTVNGSCEAGSDSVQGSVYRCFTGNSIYDPCWAVAGATSPIVTVLCMRAPWMTSVVKIVTQGLPGLTDTSGTDLDFPWAVQLTTGQQCLAAQGAHDQFEGLTINFGCEDSDLELAGGVDRSGSRWSFQSVQQTGQGSTLGPVVIVSIAWFGGP